MSALITGLVAPAAVLRSSPARRYSLAGTPTRTWCESPTVSAGSHLASASARHRSFLWQWRRDRRPCGRARCVLRIVGTRSSATGELRSGGPRGRRRSVPRGLGRPSSGDVLLAGEQPCRFWPPSTAWRGSPRRSSSITARRFARELALVGVRGRRRDPGYGRHCAFDVATDERMRRRARDASGLPVGVSSDGDQSALWAAPAATRGGGRASRRRRCGTVDKRHFSSPSLRGPATL